ncbi:hypothetical protein EV13_2048 [Prochlorococcus sp. MIT 0702]|nr:hypothetical protein EV13_2048 [Prochlorococcus sp. MIT 0702]
MTRRKANPARIKGWVWFCRSSRCHSPVMRPCWNNADQDAASNRFGISEVARLSGLPFVDF